MKNRLRRYRERIAFLVKTSKEVIFAEGFIKFVKEVFIYVNYKFEIFPESKCMRDILFIYGPTLPQVKQFRIDNQIEQLNSSGLSAKYIRDDKLTLDDVKYYRGFVFCRYPITEKAKELILEAKRFNKTIFFEIDDLVFDTEITKNITTVQEMNAQDRAQYDDGVKRSQETLKLCDYAVTTTEPLANELRKYTNFKEVFVNRNVASEKMVSFSNQALQDFEVGDKGSDKVGKELDNSSKKTVTLGYFSGSITHNEDFEMITPAIVELLKKYDYLRLHIGGILDLPDALKPFASRITSSGFVDYKLLPREIMKCDINLAPLAKQNIFNDAKSEIKWIDAGLVKVPTIATDFGAFRSEIKDDVTGVLVRGGAWFEAIERLVLDNDLRRTLGENAHAEIIRSRTTVYSGKPLADWLYSKLAQKVTFVTPDISVSGGINVIQKHAEILIKHGYDVTWLNIIQPRHIKKHHDFEREKELSKSINIIMMSKVEIVQVFDFLVATHWATMKYVKEYPNAVTRQYFVQNFETDFLLPGKKIRQIANATYCEKIPIRYATMSLWCKKWLKETFGKDAKYASNGQWSENFSARKRDFSGEQKIKVLIYGDSAAPWKNVDESARIVSKLDRSKYEISYLSNGEGPKSWYQVDNYYNKVPPLDAAQIYYENDILLISSTLESFSYPPLDMMTTGGLVVAVQNDGNAEYLQNGENCLIYEQGSIDDAIVKIEQIVNDKTLRERLEAGGLQTAQKYDWSKMEEDIVSLYE